MNTARFFMRLGALVALAGSPLAATATMAHLGTNHPIKVTNCNPQRNHYMATGYAPAYYPGGPFWGWPAVYPGYTYYQYPVHGQPTLSIDYSNATNVVMKDIEFGLIAHGNLVAEVRDVGTFSPGAEIKHAFGLSQNVFPLGTSLVECVPLKITFEDGSKWKNPHLPRLNRSIYGKPPS
jgi:hypothetical protein